MNEPKFLAKCKDNLPAIQPGGKMVGYNRITEEINLDGLSLKHFKREVESVLQRRRPVIFKAWGNQRLELDVARIGIMRNALSQMEGAIEDMARLKATDFMSERIFQCEVAFIEQELKNRAAQLQAEYHRINHERDMLDLQAQEKRAEINKIETETLILNLQARAKVQLLTAKTNEIQAKAKLIDGLAEKIVNDDNALSELSRAMIISGALKSDNRIDGQSLMMDKLEDIIIDKFSAETELIKAEARSKNFKADMDGAKSKHTINEYSKIRDTDKNWK